MNINEYKEDWSIIVPHLYQGGCPANDDDLTRFQTVVNCAHQEWAFNYPHPHGWGARYIEVALHDNDPDKYGGTAWSRIEHTAEVVAQDVTDGKEVLVHCLQGWNRSGVVVARAMIHLGWEPFEAIRTVRLMRHPMALSNPHFTAGLMKQGPSLQQDLSIQESQEW